MSGLISCEFLQNLLLMGLPVFSVLSGLLACASRHNADATFLLRVRLCKRKIVRSGSGEGREGQG